MNPLHNNNIIVIQYNIRQMLFVYVLELEHSKYYVGKTFNPNIRIDDHFSNEGAAWTTKYKPTRLIDLTPNCDDLDEDKITFSYMKKYGIENVRGGSFCRIILSKEDMVTLQKIINGSNNNCYNCGKDDHFIKNCPQLSSIKQNNCSRCNRSGHTIDKCYAKTFSNNDPIISEESEEIEVYNCSYCNKVFTTSKGAKYHENMYCKTKRNATPVKTYNCKYCNNDFKTLKATNSHEDKCNKKPVPSNDCIIC